MKNAVQKLSRLLEKMPLSEGENKTVVSFLSVYRFTSKAIALPETDSPYLYFPVSGGVRLHTPSGILDYAQGQVSVSSVDTPFYGEIVMRDEQAFTAACVCFTAEEVVSVLLSAEEDLAERIAGGKIPAAVSARAENRVAECLFRLFSLLEEPESLAFLAKHIKREILFHVLISSCGKHFLQSIVHSGGAEEIYEINSWIKRNFRENFNVEELAREWNMSVSSFHKKFKNAVGMGPLQCKKRLRLTEARRRMLNDGAAVTDAAMEVGYESLSQFIRDYKKMFGAAPKDDVLSLRRRLDPDGGK